MRLLPDQGSCVLGWSLRHDHCARLHGGSDMLRIVETYSTDLNCTQLTLRCELRAASTTDSHVARLSLNALHGAGLRLSRTNVSSCWSIRGLATLIGFCGLNILRMMLVLGLLGLITSLRDPQLCQLCL